MDIIELKNVIKKYGKDNSSACALQNISLNIKQGEMLSIMGPSGSGKSTLLNILGCMDLPTSGNYYLKGELVTNKSNTELSKIRNSSVSFVFQHFALMREYSVYENIELPLLHRKTSSKAKKDKIMYYSQKLGIENLIHKKPSQISGGQQQRVAIVRALVSEAEIILADEPTGALDQKTGKELLELLRTLNKENKTIVIVTHDNNIAQYCDRTIYISDGMITDRKNHTCY
jgi:putative ABC transport system ATP-binding protein